MPPEAAALLAGLLKRPDLASLHTQLMAKFHDHWAFGGSVALQLHSLQRNAGRGREPQDVDIEMAELQHDRLFDALKSERGTGCLKKAIAADGTPETYFLFDDELKVDLIRNTTQERRHSARFERICGVPVVSLAALKSLKNCDLDDPIESIRNKAKTDLATIKKLETMPRIPNFNNPSEQKV